MDSAFCIVNSAFCIINSAFISPSLCKITIYF